MCAFRTGVRTISFSLLASATLIAQLSALAAGPPVLQNRARAALEHIKPAPEFPAKKMQKQSKPVSASRKAAGQRQLQRAAKRFDNGHWSDAIEILKKGIDADPGLNSARVLYARAAARMGNVAAAREQLGLVLESEPRSVTAHRLLGEFAAAEQKNEAAVSAFRLALMADDDGAASTDAALSHLGLAQALHALGYLAAAAGQYDAYLAAIDQLSGSLRHDSELQETTTLFSGRAAATLGALRADLGDHEAALAAYDRALREKPDDAITARRRIVVMALAGRVEPALESAHAWTGDAASGGGRLELLREVCEAGGVPQRYDAELARLGKESSDAGAILSLARMLLARDQTQDAIKLLERIVEDKEKGIEAASLLIEIHLGSGEADRACARVGELVRRRPEAFARVMQLVKSSGKVDAFASAAHTASEKSPDDPVGRLILGDLLALEGQSEPAIDEFRAAIRLDPTLGNAYGSLALSLAQMRRWDEALDAAKSGLEREAPSRSLHLAKGMAHAALGEHEAAKESFLAAFEMAPTDAEPLYRLAEMAQRRGEHEEAEELFRRILDDVDPRHVAARERLIVHYLNRGQIDKCREYFSDYEALKIEGPAVERCRAMLALTTSGAATPQARFEEYLAALQVILEKYPLDWETHLEIARSHAAVNDFEKALAQTRRALEIRPDEPAALELLAGFLTRLLQFEEAGKVLRELLKARPRDLGYMQDLLSVADSRADWATSAALLREFLARKDLREQNATFTTMLIGVLTNAEQWDDAIAASRSWLDAAPEDGLRRGTFLATLGRAGRHDEAIAAARLWLKEEPANRILQIQLLSRLQAAKRHLEAIQLTLKWMRPDADDIDLNAALIRLCWSARRWDEAIEVARMNTERPGSRTTFESLLGDSYRFAKRFDEAADLYRDRVAAAEDRRKTIETQLQNGAPENKHAALLLGLREAITEARAANFSLVGLLIAAERYDQAERQINKMLRPELDAKTAGEAFDQAMVIDLRGFLAEVYQNTGREAQAIQQLEAVYEIDPNDPGINNNLGYSLADSGQELERAEKMIRLSLAQNPKSHASLDSLGWVLYKRGKFEDAIYYLRQALKLAGGEEPVLHDHLGDALYRADQKDAALTAWKKALEMCAPDYDPPPDRDRRILFDVVKKKIDAAEAGDPVETAPLP
ncbi:MAG TPA: tetratricopeptide repeat protein [Phycisphaerae bacterium]|nr:tetratricopeptide repeat protein [Phycisphaerae bacterium]